MVWIFMCVCVFIYGRWIEYTFWNIKLFQIPYKNIENSVPDNLMIQKIVTILFIIIFIITVWHLPCNSCVVLSEQYNERISSGSAPGVCQFPPGSGEQSKCLQGNRQVQVTYSSGAQSFVSPESGIVCVSPQPMRGPGKRSRGLQGE